MKGRYPLNILCKKMRVSRSGYYEWAGRRPSPRQIRTDKPREAAIHFYHESKGIYGYRKVRRDVVDSGLACCAATIHKQLAAEGLFSKVRRKHRYPANSEIYCKAASSILSREFFATKTDEKWVADITYIPTLEGWLYLSVVLDTNRRGG